MPPPKEEIRSWGRPLTHGLILRALRGVREQGRRRQGSGLSLECALPFPTQLFPLLLASGLLWDENCLLPRSFHHITFGACPALNPLKVLESQGQSLPLQEQRLALAHCFSRWLIGSGQKPHGGRGSAPRLCSLEADSKGRSWAGGSPSRLFPR